MADIDQGSGTRNRALKETLRRVVTPLIALAAFSLPSCNDRSSAEGPNNIVLGNAPQELSERDIATDIAKLRSIQFELEKEGREMFGISHSWQFQNYTPESRKDENTWARSIEEKGIPVIADNILKVWNKNGHSLQEQEKAGLAYIELRRWFSSTSSLIEEFSDPTLSDKERSNIYNRIDLEAYTADQVWGELDKVRPMLLDRY